MRIKITSEKFGESKDIILASILLAIALCIGVYLIITTVIIAKDGVTFIEYAKNLTVSPTSTMLSQDQHPGYPLLILAAHKMTRVFYESASIRSWIYCAQSVTLIFRLLTVIALYFIGKDLAGAKFSFWAILILILLPKPAKYGSDALSDWPHFFFLATGFLMLIRGAEGRKWWLFGFVGLTAGMGYLVRPECAQLVVYGSLWLVPQLFWSKLAVSRRKVMSALALLLIGFLVTAGPYMKLKGAVLPKKGVGGFASNVQSYDVYDYGQRDQTHSTAIYTASFVPSDIVGAFGKLAQNIGETLMWFFVLPLLIGIYKYFKERNWQEPGKLFITALIALNIPLLIWLYCKHGYISGRHTLPLVAFTIFYVPIGLQLMGSWLQDRFSKKTDQIPVMEAGRQFWFLVLLAIGLSICTPKLLTPMRTKKQSYRHGAQWLANHTEESDIIAVPDVRISFYAQRKGLEYKAEQIPEKAKYVVRIFKKENNKATLSEQLSRVEYRYVDKRNEKVGVVIYRNL